jgi:tRNA (cmo5U34)-methyltransferase
MVSRLGYRNMIEDSTISCYDAHAKMYDDYQFAVVPHYGEILEMGARVCQRYLKADSNILDLGCGTGNASLAILKGNPSHMFLLDGSNKMVKIAAKKVSRLAPGAVMGTRVSDLSNDDWAESLGDAKFDAIISTLVLEHLPFDCYRSVIIKCLGLLKPGGWLIAAEGYAEEGSDMQEWFYEEMGGRQNKFDKEFSNSIAQLRDEKEIHYYCSKMEKEMWWRKAGFENVNVIWQYLCVAMMIGRKPL